MRELKPEIAIVEHSEVVPAYRITPEPVVEIDTATINRIYAEQESPDPFKPSTPLNLGPLSPLESFEPNCCNLGF